MPRYAGINNTRDIMEKYNFWEIEVDEYRSIM